MHSKSYHTLYKTNRTLKVQTVGKLHVWPLRLSENHNAFWQGDDIKIPSVLT